MYKQVRIYRSAWMNNKGNNDHQPPPVWLDDGVWDRGDDYPVQPASINTLHHLLTWCNGNFNIIPENKEKNREHERNLYVIKKTPQDRWQDRWQQQQLHHNTDTQLSIANTKHMNFITLTVKLSHLVCSTVFLGDLNTAWRCGNASIYIWHNQQRLSWNKKRMQSLKKKFRKRMILLLNSWPKIALGSIFITSKSMPVRNSWEFPFLGGGGGGITLPAILSSHICISTIRLNKSSSKIIVSTQE